MNGHCDTKSPTETSAANNSLLSLPTAKTSPNQKRDDFKSGESNSLPINFSPAKFAFFYDDLQSKCSSHHQSTELNDKTKSDRINFTRTDVLLSPKYKGKINLFNSNLDEYETCLSKIDSIPIRSENSLDDDSERVSKLNDRGTVMTTSNLGVDMKFNESGFSSDSSNQSIFTLVSPSKLPKLHLNRQSITSISSDSKVELGKNIFLDLTMSQSQSFNDMSDSSKTTATDIEEQNKNTDESDCGYDKEKYNTLSIIPTCKTKEQTLDVDAMSKSEKIKKKLLTKPTDDEDAYKFKANLNNRFSKSHENYSTSSKQKSDSINGNVDNDDDDDDDDDTNKIDYDDDDDDEEDNMAVSLDPLHFYETNSLASSRTDKSSQNETIKNLENDEDSDNIDNYDNYVDVDDDNGNRCDSFLFSPNFNQTKSLDDSELDDFNGAFNILNNERGDNTINDVTQKSGVDYDEETFEISCDNELEKMSNSHYEDDNKVEVGPDNIPENDPDDNDRDTPTPTDNNNNDDDDNDDLLIENIDATSSSHHAKQQNKQKKKQKINEDGSNSVAVLHQCNKHNNRKNKSVLVPNPNQKTGKTNSEDRLLAEFKTAVERRGVREKDRPSAARLAKRLYFLQGFKKPDVTRHLSKRNSFALLVGEEFLRFYDFTGETLDTSLRKFIKTISLNGDVMCDREHILSYFARRYCQCNEDAFKKEATCHSLAYSLLILDQNMRSQHNLQMLRCEDFVESFVAKHQMLNVNGDNHADVPTDLLKQLYQSIADQPLEYLVEEPLEQQMLTMQQQQQRFMLQTSVSSPPSTFMGATGVATATNGNKVISNTNHFIMIYNDFMRINFDKPTTPPSREYKKGYVMRKCCLDANGKKTGLGRRGWKMLYAIIKDTNLYFYTSERASSQADKPQKMTNNNNNNENRDGKERRALFGKKILKGFGDGGGGGSGGDDRDKSTPKLGFDNPIRDANQEEEEDETMIRDGKPPSKGPFQERDNSTSDGKKHDAQSTTSTTSATTTTPTTSKKSTKLSSMTTSMTSSAAGSSSSSNNAVMLLHSLAVKANDYMKKNHVLRLHTCDAAQYLIQTSDVKDCQEWIDTINIIASVYSSPMVFNNKNKNNNNNNNKDNNDSSSNNNNNNKREGVEGGDGLSKASKNLDAYMMKFDKPLVNLNKSALPLHQQVEQHDKTIQIYERLLQQHQKLAPEKKATNKIIQEYCKKENFYLFEIRRLKLYSKLLQQQLIMFPQLSPSLAETCIGEVEEPIPSPKSKALLIPNTKFFNDNFSYDDDEDEEVCDVSGVTMVTKCGRHGDGGSSCYGAFSGGGEEMISNISGKVVEGKVADEVSTFMNVDSAIATVDSTKIPTPSPPLATSETMATNYFNSVTSSATTTTTATIATTSGEMTTTTTTIATNTTATKTTAATTAAAASATSINGYISTAAAVVTATTTATTAVVTTTTTAAAATTTAETSTTQNILIVDKFS